MPFARLYDWLPEIARAETRAVIVPAADAQFIFGEMYCDEPGCDCRRVLFQVFSTDNPSRVLATISYGWEPDSFYREWAGFPLSDDDVDELRGPGLMRHRAPLPDVPRTDRFRHRRPGARALAQHLAQTPKSRTEGSLTIHTHGGCASAATMRATATRTSASTTSASSLSTR